MKGKSVRSVGRAVRLVVVSMTVLALAAPGAETLGSPSSAAVRGATQRAHTLDRQAADLERMLGAIDRTLDSLQDRLRHLEAADRSLERDHVEASRLGWIGADRYVELVLRLRRVADDLGQTRTALLDLGRRRREVAARLATVRAALERRRQEALDRARIFQVCPVGGGTFGRSFGVLSTRGRPHVHQGVDVFASYGTPVRAPFAGTARVSTNPIGGLAVTVDGQDGFVYNAHLAAIGSIGPVAAGTVIGWVGTSGNARGTSPHDHLEWHPWGGPAADPFDLLAQAC